jgi:hypothetical protein
MHRFRWDLSHAGPWQPGGRGGGGGPTAVPGVYQVRLTAGDWSRTESFELKIDPRVAADGVTQADMEEQLALSLRVRDALSRARVVESHIRNARYALTETISQGGQAAMQARATAERLAELEARFVTAQGRYMTPMLTDQLSYLYSMLDRADQKPGRDAYERIDELEAALNANIAELRRILGDASPGGE